MFDHIKEALTQGNLEKAIELLKQEKIINSQPVTKANFEDFQREYESSVMAEQEASTNAGNQKTGVNPLTIKILVWLKGIEDEYALPDMEKPNEEQTSKAIEPQVNQSDSSSRRDRILLIGYIIGFAATIIAAIIGSQGKGSSPLWSL